MSVTAKCHNYTGCLLAYRGELITVASGAPMVCPECGKAITPVPSGAAKIWKLVPWLVLAAAIVGGAIFALPLLKSDKKPVSPNPGGTTGGNVSPAGTPARKETPETPAPRFVATTPAPPVYEPPAQITQPAKIESDPNVRANKEMRTDVLKRIDLIPNISQTNRDKLYNSVYRARSMGLVLTIPFGSGRTSLMPAEIQTMKAALEQGEVLKLRDDPTAVFVVLGYADAKGDETKNIAISQARADSVVSTMRDKCGIGNVTHAVAMGGSTLHDTQSLDKNRIAEIWVVLP